MADTLAKLPSFVTRWSVSDLLPRAASVDMPDVARIGLLTGTVGLDGEGGLQLENGDDAPVDLAGADDPYVIRLKLGREVRVVAAPDRILAIEDEEGGIVFPTRFRRILASQPQMRRVTLRLATAAIASPLIAWCATSLLPASAPGEPALVYSMRDALSALNPGAPIAHIVIARVALLLCLLGLGIAAEGAFRSWTLRRRLLSDTFRKLEMLLGHPVEMPKRLTGWLPKASLLLSAISVFLLWSAVASRSEASNPTVAQARTAVATLQPFAGAPLVINSKTNTWLTFTAAAPSLVSVRVEGVMPGDLNQLVRGFSDDGRIVAHCKTYVSRAAADGSGARIAAALLPVKPAARCALIFSTLMPSGSIQVSKAGA